MAATASHESEFSLFSKLPRELRDQIWRNSLPDKVKPTLFSYKKGCWCPRRLLPTEEGYDGENDEHNLNFEFHHDMLDAVQYAVPLAFVNREARDIALSWVREHGFEMRSSGHSEDYPIFTRSLDPLRDVLYIAQNQWDDFLREPTDRQYEPDLLDKLLGIEADITRIAVPKALLDSDAESLHEVFHYYSHLKILFVVVDPQPELQSESNSKTQQCWEIENAKGTPFHWSADRARFEPMDLDHSDDPDLYGCIEEAGKQLGQELVGNQMSNFEIWPVSARRRYE